jgi:hypothetical protein
MRTNTRAWLNVGFFVIVTIVFFALFWGTGCSLVKHDNNVVIDSVVDCSKDAVREKIPDVVDLVEFLLDGANGDPNWENYLNQLEKVGLDLIICTVQRVVEDSLKAAHDAPYGPDLPEMENIQALKLSMKASRISQNAQTWREHRGLAR